MAPFKVEQKDDDGKHYCKYCYQQTDCLIETETHEATGVLAQTTRRCKDCGSGLEILQRNDSWLLGSER